MDRSALDLLQYYQKEIRQSPDARKALKRLNITPETVDHYQLGYASGKAFEMASKEQRKTLRSLDLAGNHGDRFKDCIILPVYSESGQLADLYGIRPCKGQLKILTWQNPPRGIIGVSVPQAYPEVILTDTVLYALHVFQHGHPNVMAIRSMDEMNHLLHLLDKHDVCRVYVLSKTKAKPIIKAIEKSGIESVRLLSPTQGVSKKNLEVVGTLPLKKEAESLQLTDKTETRLSFSAKGASYRVESLSMAGIGMRVQCRAEASGISHLDKLDLASAQNRRKYSRLCGLRLGVSSSIIEDHLASIADIIDTLQLEEAQKQTRTVRKLTKKEEGEALDLLRTANVLDVQAEALSQHCGIIGEDHNRKLAVLVAASRLLPKPLGCIIRGAPSSGKSTLIQAVSRLLPIHQVLYLSRLTPQALYFLPRETLMNSVMVIDEYEGVSDSEYSLRTMMSSQCLSLAITLREGGRMPVTRTVEIPARLSVFVSATRQVNVENLSRFVELKMDSSEAQTLRVMEQIACPSHGKPRHEIATIRNANQLLKPCRVEVPYGRDLVFRSRSVLARRQFAQLMGLISAHTALHQYQRDTRPDGDSITVLATKEDYRAVHSLLSGITESPEETLSPAASELLKALQVRNSKTLTIRDVMESQGWSYSKAYRVLVELHGLRLVEPDNDTNGVTRVYSIAPYATLDKGLMCLPDPDTV